jgi:chemotaxis protein MotB
MAAGGRRRRGGGGGHEGPDERWLLTYADMITLLMALFIVMFAISSVNTSKFEALSKSLKEAFNGSVVDGGKSVLQTGASDKGHNTPQVQAPIPAIQPLIQKEFAKKQKETAKSGSAKQNEQEEFKRVKKELDAYVARNKLQNKVETQITRRGLVIRLLTDNVLFDSGDATLKPAGKPLLGKVATLLQVDRVHPINVEGHTDNVPIRSANYPTNWELSTARAASVVRLLISDKVPATRLGAVGYAQLHPIASNDSAGGKSRNRRVEIVLLRINQNAAP